MARIISGKLRLKIDAVSLAEVAQTAIDVVAPGAAAKQIAIEMSSEEDLPLVSGDAERLQQVIWNLLSNALKFTKAGGLVRLAIERASGNVRLTVRDNGQGISTDFLPFVFDRFRQSDASSSRRHGGLGSASRWVRQIVELHGGTWGCERRRRAGRHILVRDTVAEGNRAHVVPAASTARRALDGVSVLIVDDESDARSCCGDAAGLRHNVVAVDPPTPPILRASRSSRTLVSDVGMPETDGPHSAGSGRRVAENQRATHDARPMPIGDRARLVEVIRTTCRNRLTPTFARRSRRWSAR
jgi:two-component sensor histidine kinase